MKLKTAMKKAKATGKPQKVTEPITDAEVKVNVNFRIDGKILAKIKAEAKDRGLPYQTLMNSIFTERYNQKIHLGWDLDILTRLTNLEQMVLQEHQPVKKDKAAAG